MPTNDSADAPPPPMATRIEAVLIASDRPVSIARMREALALDDDATADIKAAIDELNNLYDQTERSFRIEPVAGGFRFMTRAPFGADVAALRGPRDAHKLSRAALETLAIIAYRQPTTRAQLEAIRGVATGEVLRTLLEARLIAITGRAEELGRPMLYATTRHFLETFGLASIRDLPPVDASAEKAFPSLLARQASAAESEPDVDADVESESAPTDD